MASTIVLLLDLVMSDTIVRFMSVDSIVDKGKSGYEDCKVNENQIGIESMHADQIYIAIPSKPVNIPPW